MYWILYSCISDLLRYFSIIFSAPLLFTPAACYGMNLDSLKTSGLCDWHATALCLSLLKGQGKLLSIEALRGLRVMGAPGYRKLFKRREGKWSSNPSLWGTLDEGVRLAGWESHCSLRKKEQTGPRWRTDRHVGGPTGCMQRQYTKYIGFTW